MDKVLCQCVACEAKLGIYSNLWTQIGKGYYSPVLDGEGGSTLVAQGSKREGEEGTLVADCVLQDLACSKCNANVGLKCVSSPINHVLSNDQILLRQAAVRMVSPRGRKPKEMELKVQRVLKLKEAPRHAAQQHASPKTPATSSTQAHRDASHMAESYAGSSSAPGIFERMQAELDLQRSDIDRIDTAAFSVVSSFNTSVTRIDMELEKLNDTMKSLRRELDQQKSDLAPLKSGLDEFKSAVEDKTAIRRLEEQIDLASDTVASARQLAQDAQTRQDELQGELQSTKKDLRLLQKESSALRQEVAGLKKAAKETATTSNSHMRDLALLKSEMRQMKDALKQEQERPRRPDPTSLSYSAEEVQILSNNIAKLASRTNEFSNLQMHVDLLNLRLQRLEGRVGSAEQTRRSVGDAAREQPAVVSSTYPMGSSPGSRKRQARDIEADPVLETPSRRPEGAAEDTAHVAGSSPMPRTTNNKQLRKETFSSSSTGKRLTKNGAIDRRAMKRTAKKPLGGLQFDSIYSPPDD